MRRYFNILIMCLAALFLMTSCEDVIEVETGDAPTLVVVDAWLTNKSEPQVIKLVQTQPYFDSSPSRPLVGAQVKLLKNSGDKLMFEDKGDGTYVWTPEAGATIGKIGDNFTLNIVWNEREFVSTTSMNRIPEIEEITQEVREGELGPDGIYTSFFARDIPGIGDVYWIKTYKNGSFLGKPSEINIAFDASTDAGAEVDGVYFIPPIREVTNPLDDLENSEEIPSPWAVGDIIRIEIHSLSLEAFDFMELARDQMLNGNNTIFATPIANTTGNITNLSTEDEVLGIFNVASVSSEEKTIE